MADGHKRPLTTFDIVNQHLMVDYEDPADQPKRNTTYDTALEALTVEYPPVTVGATQVMNGVTFEWNGKEWIGK
jgi:hypothetical protein